MVKTWQVTFEGDDPGPEDDWVLSFLDAQEYIPNRMLNQSWIEALDYQLRNITHYNPYKNVKSVESSTGDDISDTSIGVILAVTKEDELRIGLLFSELSEGFEIVAIGDANFANACKRKIDIYKAMMVRLVQDPDFFKDVSIVLPIDK